MCVVCVMQLKRVHFHDFMLDVHERLRHHSGQDDPLKRVADDIATDIKVGAHDWCPDMHCLLP